MSKLSEYLFSDGYKIGINIITTIGIILFIIVIYITYSNRKKTTNFKLTYIIMINVMISGILSPLGYLLNWKIEKKNSTEKELIFGDSDGFLCQSQSFILSFFQSSRETFLTLLLFVIFLNFFTSKNLNMNKLIYKILIHVIGYGIPFIANLIYLIIGVFGESHLFCFTKLNKGDITTICGTIHFIYILVLVILSICFLLYIIIKECCYKKKDLWNDDENENIGCMNSDLSKIIFYPIAQILSMNFIFYYRFKDFYMSDNNDKTEIEKKNYFTKVAGIAAVINAISSIMYTLIFIFSNNIFYYSNKNVSSEDIEDVAKTKEGGKLLV